MDAAGVRDPDDEFVEVGTRMEPVHADGGERGLQLQRTRGSARSHVPQPVRPDRGEVDGRRERQERLVGADVAGRLLAADVLLAGAHRHDEGATSFEVLRLADEAPGDLAHERVGAGNDAQVRATVAERDAQWLALASRDVRAVLTRRCQDGQRHGLDHADEQGSRAMRQPAHLGHVLQQAQDVGLRHHDACHRPARVGEQAGQRLEVRGSCQRPVGQQRDLVGGQARTVRVRLEGPAVVRVDPAGDQDPLAAGRPAGHQGGFGRRRTAVVVRGGHHVQPGQFGQHRLVLVDALERALAHLGLVRRVGGVPLAAEQHLVHDRWGPVTIGAGAQEARQVHPVPGREPGQPCRELKLRLGTVETERSGAQRDGDVIEQLVDRGDPDRLEHPRPIIGRVRAIRHEVSPRRSAARTRWRRAGHPPGRRRRSGRAPASPRRRDRC